MPFIKKHNSDGNYVFWSDLTSSHYTETVLDFFIENRINHVDKVDNQANLLEVRPIEDFWSILKDKVYENNWRSKSLKELEDSIVLCLKNIPIATIQKLIRGVNKRLDKIR